MSKKRMQLKSIAWTYYRILPFPILVLLTVFLVSLGGNSLSESLGFLTSLCSMSVLALLCRKFQEKPEKLRFKTQAFSFLSIWFLVILISSIPFMMTASLHGYGDFSSALFESMSGYTSTGLTMAVDPSKLSSSMQLYRSLMQWIGGAGFVLFAVLVIDKDMNIEPMLKASGFAEHELKKGQSLLRAFFSVYIALTVLTFFGLLFWGVPIWEGFNHSLTVVSTGGFTVTKNSLLSYSNSTLVFISLALFFSALPFPVFYCGWKEKSFKYLLRTQIVFYFFWICFFLFAGFAFAEGSERNLFNTISAATSAGFSALNVNLTTSFQLKLFVILMIIGGCTVSTAGGIKIYRLQWIFKGIFYRFFYNNPASEAQKVPDKVFRQVCFAVLYLILSIALREVVTFTLIKLEPTAAPSDISFDTASAIATTGLSSGFTSSTLSDGSKYLLSFLMFVGRLEYIVISASIIYIISFFNPKSGDLKESTKNSI